MAHATPPDKIAAIQASFAAGLDTRENCIKNEVSKDTVLKYAKGAQTPAMPVACPLPVAEAGGPTCPKPIKLEWEPFIIDSPGQTALLCDPHIPCHDMPTIDAWMAECRHRAVKTIILNGDVMDCAGCSDHERLPTDTRFEEDLLSAEQFMQWVRARNPNARIVYKQGNHEARLPRYLAQYAPDIAKVKKLELSELLNLKKLRHRVGGKQTHDTSRRVAGLSRPRVQRRRATSGEVVMGQSV